MRLFHDHCDHEMALLHRDGPDVETHYCAIHDVTIKLEMVK